LVEDLIRVGSETGGGRKRASDKEESKKSYFKLAGLEALMKKLNNKG